jgi:ADP-heptose:LPS heptosyltransferase
MKRILVTQTTRMGDVLQTSPLVRQIRALYPDAHIALMVRGMGKVIAERHPDVNEVILYNEDDIFQDLRSGDSNRLLHAYQITEERVRSLQETGFEVAYNVTHSIASGMLLKLIGIPEVVGAHLSEDWQFILRGAWTKYFFTSVFSREYNDLNLCDIFRHFAADAPPCQQLLFEVRDEDRAFVDALYREHGIGPYDFVACFQLGASSSSKRWSEKRFAELGRLLVERRNARLLLLGVNEEAPLGETFNRYAPDLAIPLFGKTTIPQAAAMLERASVLVTNDTGTMHLAAAVGCPITLVSVGHVHYRETGPYGAGHCAIEWRRRTLGRSDFVPGGEDEREQITAEQVYHAVTLTLEDPREGPLKQFEVIPELEKVDLYITRFAPDRCLEFYPVIRRAMTQQDFLRIAYRAMWLDHLNRGAVSAKERDSIALMLEHYDGPGVDTFRQWHKELEPVFKGLADLSRRGQKITEDLLDILEKNKGMKRAQTRVAELMALDEEARVFSEIHPPARPLILITRYERDNLEGADPLVLARTTRDIYRACYQRATLLTQKIRRILELCEQSKTNP